MELVSVRTETDYTNLLRQLLPPGPAWEGEEIQDLIAKLAKEMARTDQRIYALFSEMDIGDREIRFCEEIVRR